MEPSIGSLGGTHSAESTNQERWPIGTGDDREGGDVVDEPHDEADSGDDEPSFGWSEMADQSRALKIAGSTVIMPGGKWAAPDWDLEGPDADLEPSLGSALPNFDASHDQTHWATGSRDDREEAVDDEPQLDAGDEPEYACEDEGAQCDDEGAEEREG